MRTETLSQNALEVKNAYESNADTNAFTDAEKTKLNDIETGATNNANDIIALTDELNNKADTSRFEGFNKITVGTTAPSSPSVGDIWIDTN